MLSQTKKNISSVLVIGGGVAGATAAGRLGRAGVSVHLIEKEADIGGHVKEMGCKATDVCMRCNVCVAHDILRKVKTSPNVTIYMNTVLGDIRKVKDGSRYTAVLYPGMRDKGGNSKKKTGYVQIPPELRPDKSKNIRSSIDVDAIVIATGYEPYNPVENSSFGYGSVPNVITGMEAECQLAAQHRITRVTDGESPERIAFIQCVGSRTEEIFRRPEDTDYCSTVCCSYALRMARLMKYQAEESQITVFYMDIQNFGKGFNTFYNECKGEMRFIRSRPYEIKTGDNDTVRVRYTSERENPETGSVCEEEFDLVILSVGIRPAAENRALADKLGLAVDEQGFLGLNGVSNFPDLQRDGVFVAGACESPMDIAGSIAQAEAVSTAILSFQ